MLTATERVQEATQAAAAAKHKVAMDTCCVRYYISKPPVQPWANCLEPIFHAGLEGRIELYVSTVVVSELLAHMHFCSRDKVGYDPETDLLAILNRHFHVLDVNAAVARTAGMLRGTYVPGDRIALGTPDALIGATSLANGHTLFVTNDAQLATALPSSNCVYLRDVGLEWLARSFPGPCLDGSDPILPTRSTKGFPYGISARSLAPNSIPVDPSAKLGRILRDACTVASAVSEPCAFFILSAKSKRGMKTEEVLFWREGLATSSPARKMLQILREYLGYSPETGMVANTGRRVHVFVFVSLALEHERQNRPCFASKSDHQRESDSWNRYLSIFRAFRPCIELPHVTWLLCEDGMARSLDVSATATFLDQARNVLGWKNERG